MLSMYNQANINEPLDSTARENEALEILDYGTNNAFPAKLLDNVEYSHVTNRCIDVIYKFIVGDGFEDPSLNDVIINSDGQTLGELHQSLAMDLAYFEGIYTNAKYNSNLQTTEYFHLPFENSRLGMYNELGKITNIKYNPNWGQTSGVGEQECTTTYPVYNMFSVSSQIQELGAAYRGQVLYSHIQRPQKRFYPVPQYYSAENWIKVDSKIGNFHVNNIDNNFLLSVLLKVVGDPDEAATKLEKDENDRVKSVPIKKKKGQVFKDEMAKNFSGSENGGKVMVLWAKTKEQFPELEEFPASTNHDLFIALQNLVTDNLVIAAGVPRVLANIGTAGKLGDTNEITSAVKYMQGTVQSQQSLLEDHYKKLFKNSAIPELNGTTPKIKRFSYDFTDNITGLPEQG